MAEWFSAVHDLDVMGSNLGCVAVRSVSYLNQNSNHSKLLISI